MLKKLTIAMLALILILGTTAWAQIERNPGSRSGTEVENDEVNRARPPKPPTDEAEEKEPRPAGDGVLAPPPIYLTTQEVAQLKAMAECFKRTAASVAENSTKPVVETAPLPEPADTGKSWSDFAFPGEDLEPAGMAPVADETEPPAPPVDEAEAAPVENEPTPVVDDPAPVGDEPVATEPADLPEPVLEPLSTEDEEPATSTDQADEPVVLETEEVSDDPAERPERLSVYSPGYDDDSLGLAEQAAEDPAEPAEAASDDQAPVEEPAAEPEHKLEPGVDFHTNWVPRNVNAHRGVGGTRRELPQAGDPEPEPAPRLPLPVAETEAANDDPQPAQEPAVQPEPTHQESDVDSLFTDSYPLEELLGRDEAAPAPVVTPSKTEPAPTADTGASRDWERSTDDTPRPNLDRPNLQGSGGFKPLVANPGTTNRAPTEPQLYFGEPMMPDWNIAAGITNLSRGNPRLKQVALTFDDGPHPEFTSQLLSVLDFYDVPATFFFVGVQAQKYPHWVKMTNQAGHELACHTYDHFRLPKLPREEKAYQIDEFQRLVENLTGVTPRFLRPPGGRLDAETGEMLAERGMVLAMWDVAINDTYEGKTKDDTLGAALKNIRPGSVVLAHDGIQATIDMLPELITILRAQGYTFVTLSEMAAGL